MLLGSMTAVRLPSSSYSNVRRVAQSVGGRGEAIEAVVGVPNVEGDAGVAAVLLLEQVADVVVEERRPSLLVASEAVDTPDHAVRAVVEKLGLVAVGVRRDHTVAVAVIGVGFQPDAGAGDRDETAQGVELSRPDEPPFVGLHHLALSVAVVRC